MSKVDRTVPFLGLRRERVLMHLVDEALGTCEPECVDEKATEHTRDVLRRKFARVLYPTNSWPKIVRRAAKTEGK